MPERGEPGKYFSHVVGTEGLQDEAVSRNLWPDIRDCGGRVERVELPQVHRRQPRVLRRKSGPQRYTKVGLLFSNVKTPTIYVYIGQGKVDEGKLFIRIEMTILLLPKVRDMLDTFHHAAFERSTGRFKVNEF